MAWRIHENLVEGEMDNTTPGRVSGTLRFVGRARKVTLDLEGDFNGALRGKRIHLHNPEACERNLSLRQPGSYMRGFKARQVGEVHCIERFPDGMLHAAWYENTNGRVVMELPAAAWNIESKLQTQGR